MWRGYVQMISRDLSMPFKGFCFRGTPNFYVPPGGTAGQRLPAPLAGAALIAQRVRYLNRPCGRILKRRPEGRRFLGVYLIFLGGFCVSTEATIKALPLRCHVAQ